MTTIYVVTRDTGSLEAEIFGVFDDKLKALAYALNECCDDTLIQEFILNDPSGQPETYYDPAAILSREGEE